MFVSDQVIIAQRIVVAAAAHIKKLRIAGKVVSIYNTPNFATSVILVVLIVCGAVFAQPDTLWTAQIQETGNPVFYDAVALSTGEFVLSGETNPGFNNSNMLFSRISEEGDVLWTRSYGPAGIDAANAIGELHDGTLVSVGCRNTNNLILIGLASNGDSLWSRSFTSGGATCLNDLVVRSDGTIAAVGTGIGNDGIHSDVLLAIYDPTVDSLIVRTYGSDASESGLTISLKPDGDMIVAGTTTGFGSVDGNIWLLELDSSGGEVSYSVIQHTGADAAYSNVQVESGTILCGKTTVAGQNLGFAISTTEQFDTLWTREFAESSAEVQLRGVTVSRSGNLIAAGWSGASWNTRQCWLVAIESDGTVDWNWLHGTPGSGFYGITDVPAGGYLAFGQLVIGNSRRAYAARIFLSKLTGLVIDNSDGTPVEGAKVSTSEQNIFTTTDSEGRFILAASNGIHDVFIERHCFSKDTLESINIAPDEIRDINVSLLSPGLATSLSSINVFVPNQETIAVPLTISNPADGYLEIEITTVSISPEGDWLSVTPESAVIAAGDSLTVMVQISSENQASGNLDLTGRLILYSNSCPRDTLEIPVFVLLLEAGISPFIPDQFTLSSYPNPFNSSTTLHFNIPQAANIDLSVYSITGQLVQQLANGMRTVGSHEIRFDASDLSSGLYFVKLANENRAVTTKVILLK